MSRGFVVLFVSLVLSLSVQAQATPDDSTENIVTGINAQGEKVFLIRYAEERVWRVEEIVQRADGWPDVVSRRYFHDRSEAEQAQVALKKNLIALQNMNPMMQIQNNEMVLQGGSIWPTTQSWSWEWEKKYANWLMDNMDAGFFKKYGIATDCADVAYAARWIFARIHGLPAANRLASGSLMTNQSLRSEWSSLPTAKNWFEDRRFMRALNYLLNLTYTHSLIRDSYPVAITADNFLPGIHYLDVREVSGHTQLVHRVDLSETDLIPFYIIQSTTPRKVRELSESIFWGNVLSKKGRSGFLRIVWPKVKKGTYILEKAENMPGYSLEQYDEGFIREKGRANSIEVLLRLKPTLNFVNVVKSGYQNLKDMFKARLEVVEEGYRLCSNRSCDPAGATYDAWSTPSRDKHITELMNQLQGLLMLSLPVDVKAEMIKIVAGELLSPGVQLNGEDFTVGALMFAWRHKLYSSDPNDEPGLRWGLAPEFFALKLKNNLQKYLQERKTKINPESDNILKADFTVSRQYCSAVSEAQCLRFKSQELLKPLSLLGQNKTLQAWLDQSLWLNSDPLQSSANQWGAIRSQIKFQELDASVKSFLVSEDGIGFMESKKGQIQLGPIGLNGIEDTSLPAGFSWAVFQKETSVGWAVADGQLLRYDFKTQTQNIYVSPLKGPAELLQVGDSQILAKTQGELWSLQFSANTAIAVWHESITKAKRLGENLIAIEQAGQNKILDFKGLTPVALAVNEDIFGAHVFKETPQFIGIGTAEKRFFVNRHSGEVIDVSTLGIGVAWSDSLTKVIVWKLEGGGVYLLTLNSQFQMVSSRKLSDFVNFSGGYVFLMFMSSPSKLLQIKGDNFEEILPRADESHISDAGAPWTVWKLKNGESNFRIRHVDGSKSIYEGPLSSMIHGQKEMELGLLKQKDVPTTRLISLKNPNGLALMTGQFEAFQNPPFEFEGLVSTDRGAVLFYKGYKFWAEFP